MPGLQQQLNNIAIRWYNPEYFPTVDLMTISEAGYAVGIQDFYGFFTNQNLDACDVVGSWSENFFTSGGGTVNINDNPTFPDVIRLTACVQRNDWEEDGEFTDSQNSISLNSVGEQQIQVPYPNGGYGSTAWTNYTNCIDEGGDDCGIYLSFNQNGTGTMINTTFGVYLALSHVDLSISGWTGCIGNHSDNSSNMSYIGNNTDLEADYVLTENDITTSNDGISCLSILDNTKFGANGSYQAEFNVGDRVRIYGSKPEFNIDNTDGQSVELSDIFTDYIGTTTVFAPIAGGGYNNPINFQQVDVGEGIGIDNFFNGDTPENYTNQFNVGNQLGFQLNNESNEFGVVEDIDGQGFLSPFFINLWRASVYSSTSSSVCDNIMTAGSMFGSNSNPLNPTLGNIRESNIYSRVDSRIKYIIFQNTLGMMYDNPDWNVSGQEDDFDYGQVPVSTINNSDISARRHNKVHVYIVFRDEWVGQPITYGADDSRSTVNLDIDGRARMVSAADNDILENL